MKLLLTLALAAYASSAGALTVLDDSTQVTISDTLEPVIVTAPKVTTPLRLHFDPRTAQQPVPAHDGAAILKTVPGMAVIRKGGTDGDPVFRGMAGSRLNILLDGEQILGGCGFRMDPPTAYVSPETFDRVTLLKGPQTVLHGPGNAAGTVLFERETPHFDRPGYRFNLSPTGGNFGRADGTADVQIGTPRYYARGLFASGRSGNYEDGAGRLVHSEYNRWNARAALGWTPDPDTRLELSATRGDGRAAYADRGVDGARFANTNYGLRFSRQHLRPFLEQFDAQAYYNYVDHVMDDYTLRAFAPAGPGQEPSAMNPDRLTTGGRFAVALQPVSRARLTLGGDLQHNRHTNRNSMSMNMGMAMGGMDMDGMSGKAVAYTPGQTSNPYQDLPRVEDAAFDQQGLFAEWTQALSADLQLTGGMRLDRWQARDHRQGLGMMGTPNPTAGQSRRALLPSAFARVEADLGRRATLYAGLGHNERFPDYWELISADKQGPEPGDLSAFSTTAPEKTTQLDLGATIRAGRVDAFVSAFYSRIGDFILIQTGAVGGMGTVATQAVVRNIDASTLGGEAGLTWRPGLGLRLTPNLAYVRGANRTEDRPLAQMPPLETRLSVDWERRAWSAGSLLRIVADQKRYAVGEGNIAGQDLGPTPGFAVFSLNAGWKPRPDLRLAAGVDNLFDQHYYEHLSRAGDLVPGFPLTDRIEEPGRTLWAKASFSGGAEL